MTEQAGQKGTIVKKNGWWVLRYRATARENGIARRVLRAKRLSLVAEFPPKRHRGRDGKDVPNAIANTASEFLANLNKQERGSSDASLVRLGEFVETVFLPFIKAQRRPSTYKNCSDIWRVHLKARAEKSWLRDIQTFDVQTWLNEIETTDLVRELTDEEKKLSDEELAELKETLRLTHSSLARIKSFLSGVFKHALQMGFLSGVNPATGTSIPKGKDSAETHAYELRTIQKIMGVLPEPASTIIALAGIAGLRRGEIRGLLWENYSGQTLRVTQSIWNSHVNTPKTPASQDDVPVIPALKTKLDLWRLRCGNPASGLIFPSSTGTPIELNNVLNRVILPALQKARIPWHGYHAFRRGLATNLHDAGVNDLTIQRILRHSDVSVTRRAYIKRLPQQATDAMEKIQTAMDKAAAEDAGANVN
jgi:integrase